MTDKAKNGHINHQSQEEKTSPLVLESYINYREDWSHSTKEILDSLPRVWTRGLLYFLVIFVGITLPWAMLGKVDETGTATGKLEPQGKTLKLDAPVEGKVSLINVKEGDIVKAGDRLMEIESDIIEADLKQQKNKLEGQEKRLQQLQILEKQLQVVFQTQKQQNQAQELEKLAQVNQAKSNLLMLRNSYDSQQSEKQAQVNQAQEDLEYNKEAIKLAEIQLQNAQEVKDRYDTAVNQGIVSEIQVVEKEDVLQERKKNYEQLKSDIEKSKHRLSEQQSSYQRTIKEAKGSLQEAELKLKEQENSYQSIKESGELSLLKNKEQINSIQRDITSLISDVKQTTNQIESLEYQLNQRVIKAPIGGIVFDLPIDTEGSVLQPGKRILEIAPQGTNFILRAQMTTAESGSVSPGMRVKMKFDAYPFQDFGVIEGKLTEVSPTTKEIETSDGKILVYNLTIELDTTCIPTPDECIKLRPGDTAIAEVIIRQRRIIDFILDPFKKLQNGGFKL